MTTVQKGETSHEPAPRVSRRGLLATGAAGAVGLAGIAAIGKLFALRASVFVARHQRYDGPLEQTIRDGLIASGVRPEHLRGKTVLLKPNLVEPVRERPHITTHPAVIVAAADVFKLGAEVLVGEAPGHVRDTEMALIEAGVLSALQEAGLPFADLNYQQVQFVRNRGRRSKLSGFYFPQSVIEADLVVSLPKLKTHHWVGMTASLKNFYGVLPGIKYGWPKNVLHHAGIPETVIDISASLPATMTIIDGIDCMEGDGPIMGSCKHLGLILVGQNPTAVDATAARIMGLDPTRISYLKLAANRLGPVADRRIEQRGERWQPLRNPFQLIDLPHVRKLRLG